LRFSIKDGSLGKAAWRRRQAQKPAGRSHLRHFLLSRVPSATLRRLGCGDTWQWRWNPSWMSCHDMSCHDIAALKR
jgi:hypothetical protein